MIPVDFDYYRPDTIEEAVQIYQQLYAQGKAPVYYGGGSEVITMARSGSIQPGAVIDLKAIPECLSMGLSERFLSIGSCVTLSRISESGLFPLLGKAAGRIADHTNQCRITLGGNVCGTIIYRETVLALLLADCTVVTGGPGGERQASIHTVFRQRMQLEQGEFIIRFLIDRAYLDVPYIHVKKTKNEKIDYPLLTVAAMNDQGRIRMAFSGLCAFPFRSFAMEDILNDAALRSEEKAERIKGELPGGFLDNVDGTGPYRAFVLKNTVVNALERLGGWNGKV